MTDLAGDGILAAPGAWTFNSEEVALSFDDHVSKSVPFYNEGHLLVHQLSDYFLHDNSSVLDLGCSTGSLLRALASRHSNINTSFVGYDQSIEMLDVAKNRTSDSRISYSSDSFLTSSFESTSLITSYYTLQFIHPSVRQKFFDHIYSSLEWGGGFIFFEKVRAPDARFQDICNSLYSEFKTLKGYTPSEIHAKSLSLRGRLEPFTSAANLDFASRAGFTDIISIFKYICFQGFLCIK
ncbi:methyltransferase domain protein [Synechococcus sp. A18-46.1]|nr:methyltransferase domain protein [Synechococcus sp. A18-46.1]